MADSSDTRRAIEFRDIPAAWPAFADWNWARIEPYYAELAERGLSAAGLDAWLADWTRIACLVDELGTRLHIATTVDTADAEAERRFFAYLDGVSPEVRKAEQVLMRRLVEGRLKPPEGFELPMRHMQAQIELFREENLPLLTQERKLASEYDKIAGAQTVVWDGAEKTIAQLKPIFQDPDRERRERAWRAGARRQIEDRKALGELWTKLLDLRLTIAGNAGFGDYRSYRWKAMQRFDYSPENCKTLAAAIEQVVVPAAGRIYARRAERLKVDSLRPWDLDVDPLGREPLRPFAAVGPLTEACERIFHRVDPDLGRYFQTMRVEDLLDLDNRKGKAPGGYCATLSVARRPFVFMNAVGIHDDVQTLLHEAGHSFHVFEAAHLPYHQQAEPGLEFAEVASMSMELLAGPYLDKDAGGFYDASGAARARIEHLEGMILFWPYMAVVDGFQHWVYENPDDARRPGACDAAWDGLWQRFMPGVDWTGLEEERKTGWQRKLHIFHIPFYYVEYGLAQLGATLVWKNSLDDEQRAVAAYRSALRLGGTANLPTLFATAGARFAFDAQTMGEAVSLIEKTLERLDGE